MALLYWKLHEALAALHMSFCFSAYFLQVIGYPAVIKMDQNTGIAQRLLKRIDRQRMNRASGADCLRRGNPGSLTG